MRILMLSWEYPPKVVGGIARHVCDLSRALADGGVEVDVITCEHPDAPPEETHGKLRIHRVQVPLGNDFVHWVHNLNAATEAKADELLESSRCGRRRGPVIIHSHDWLSAVAGKG